MQSGTETPFAQADNCQRGSGRGFGRVHKASRCQDDAQGESAQPCPAFCSGRHAAIGPIQMQQSPGRTNERDLRRLPYCSAIRQLSRMQTRLIKQRART